MRKEDLLDLIVRQLHLLDDVLPWDLETLQVPKGTVSGLPAATPSGVSFKRVSAYAHLAHMDFLMSKLESEGVDASRFLARRENYERRLRDFYKDRQATLVGEVNRGLRRLLEWFDSAVHAIDPATGRFPYDTDHEFENDVFATRELVEFASIESQRLEHRYDFDRYLAQFSARDDKLRTLLPFAVAKVVQFGGRMDPAGLYPDQFWWRKAAWESYRQYTGIDDQRNGT